MRIGMICKYPPIVGGVSSKGYWLSRALAELGHDVHVITNAHEVEGTYREKISLEDLQFMKHPNLHIHATSPGDIPAYIPKGNPFEVKLASLAIDVIQQFRLDLLDCWYFLPNGVAGYLAHTITGIPWVVRHAGSDLGRILPHHLFETLLKNILARASRVVTQKGSTALMLSLGVSEKRLWFSSKDSVNTLYFSPEGETEKLLPLDKPVILAMGKLGEVKGTFDLLRSFVPVKDKAYLAYVTGGPNIEGFKKEVRLLGIEDSVKMFCPVPPWRVPDIIRGCRVFVHAERDFPIIKHRPIIPREIMACGKSMILSQEMYGRYDFLKTDKNVITVNPHNHQQFTEALEKVVTDEAFSKEIGAAALATSVEIEDFPGYVKSNEELYNSVINK